MNEFAKSSENHRNREKAHNANLEAENRRKDRIDRAKRILKPFIDQMDEELSWIHDESQKKSSLILFRKKLREILKSILSDSGTYPLPKSEEETMLFADSSQWYRDVGMPIEELEEALKELTSQTISSEEMEGLVDTALHQAQAEKGKDEEDRAVRFIKHSLHDITRQFSFTEGKASRFELMPDVTDERLMKKIQTIMDRGVTEEQMMVFLKEFERKQRTKDVTRMIDSIYKVLAEY